MIVSREVWKDIRTVLKKHKVPYAAHLEGREIPNPVVGQRSITVYDNHILINLIIPDYFDDEAQVYLE